MSQSQSSRAVSSIVSVVVACVLVLVPLRPALAQSIKLSPLLAASGDVSQYVFTPDGQRVLFAADPTTDDIFQLYTVPISGGVPLALTAWPQVSSVGSIQTSADSRYAVFSHVVGPVTEIYSVRTDGGAPVRLNSALVLSGTVAQYAITPDSNTVVYLADQQVDGRHELFRVPIAGGIATKISPALVAGGTISTFQLTPDGTRAVYLADQQTDDVFELFSLSVAGGASVRLSGNMTPGGSASSFQIASDGQRVVYLADQRTKDVFELFSALTTGGGVTNLNGAMIAAGDVGCRPIIFFFGITFRVLFFLISPDGKRVIYCADQIIDEDIELFSVPIAGGDSTKLNGPLTAGGDVYNARFTPDSTRVVYQADQRFDERDDLFVVPTLGGAPDLRVSGDMLANGEVFSFQMSPDGNHVIYNANQQIADSNELFSAPLAGGATPKLNPPMNPASDISSFAYDRTGRRAYFLARTAGENATMLYGASALRTGDVITLSASQVTSGNVLGFAVNPVTNHLIYLADQDTNDQNELYVTADTVSSGVFYLPIASRLGGFEVEPNDNAGTATVISASPKCTSWKAVSTTNTMCIALMLRPRAY